jgi:hypothetical protein
MRFASLALTFLCVCALTHSAVAQPSWAKQRDSADKGGHTFICEGAGATEPAALAAAFGVCNDKICKVCGVEVESVVKTKETLSSVGMERLVTERCRRVRKHDPTVKFKNVDCGPQGCRAWVQVFYSKSDEEAECPRYADEKFEDPARCEIDIDEYARQRGISAESFRIRRDALQRALADCRSIDVRPTPALMALDAKLHAGLDSFETKEKLTNDSEEETLYTRFPAGFREGLRQTKTLIGRIQPIRDFVHDRFLIFSVHEAAVARDRDTPAGVQRFLAAIQRCPPGRRFGAIVDVNIFSALYFRSMKTDTTSISDALRKMYPPEALRCTNTITSEEDALITLFVGDDRATPGEWDYVTKVAKLPYCHNGTGKMTNVRNQGGDDLRLKRLLSTYQKTPETTKPNRSPAISVLPVQDPEFLLRIETQLPEDMRSWYDTTMWEAVYESARRAHATPELLGKLAARYAETLGHEPAFEPPKDYCKKLPGRLSELELAEAPGLTAAARRLCWCLNGALAEMPDNRYPKKEIFEISMKKHLACRCPFDPSKTRTALTFDWKKGQTPTTYGKYADKKYKFTIQVDPAWQACAKKFANSLLYVNFYVGDSAEAAMTSKTFAGGSSLRLASPKEQFEGEGYALCDKKSSFVSWELKGEGEHAVLSGNRQVAPIHCE